MNGAVPKTTGEFLFLGDAASPLLTGFRINGDGSLAPLPGSPFPIGAPARGLRSAQDVLIVETESGASAYRVNRETGQPRPADSAALALSAAALQPSVASGPQTAVLDASGNFMFVLDTNRAELLAFKVEGGKLSPVSTAYPVSSEAVSIALVKL